MKFLTDLQDKKIIHVPEWLPTSVNYLTMMGSHSYGTNTPDSDFDLYGFCIPPKMYIFPTNYGYIPGFSKDIPRFDNWDQNVVVDGKEYDFNVFSIVKYFRLLTDNNPNIIDSLFTRREDVWHCTEIGNMIRDNRKIFLHKGSYHKYKGYAFSQMHKIRSLTRHDSKRKDLIEKYGYDTKFGAHCVRLLLQIQQILIENDLDLKRNSDILKSIRNGDWKLEDLEKWFFSKERDLESVYANSKLPAYPDEKKIRDLLINCLEHHYGKLDEIKIPSKAEDVLKEIAKLTRDFNA